MGRLCLEAGRKHEALEYFNKVQKMLRDTQSDNPLMDNDAISNIIDNDHD